MQEPAAFFHSLTCCLSSRRDLSFAAGHSSLPPRALGTCTGGMSGPHLPRRARRLQVGESP